jgi:hypothetical protein
MQLAAVVFIAAAALRIAALGMLGPRHAPPIDAVAIHVEFQCVTRERMKS